MKRHQSFTACFVNKTTAIAASLVLVSAVIAGCGSSQPDSYETPSTRGPVAAGVDTCGYMQVPAECQDSGLPQANWHQIPQDQPMGFNYATFNPYAVGNTTEMLMWYHYLRYSPYYSSPSYYNTYIPAASRRTYINHVTAINKHYGSEEKLLSAKAPYKDSATGKVTTGNKVDIKQFGNTKNNGGNRTTKNCSMRAPGGTSSIELASFDSYKPSPRPAPPARSGSKSTGTNSNTKTNSGGDRGRGTNGSPC